MWTDRLKERQRGVGVREGGGGGSIPGLNSPCQLTVVFARHQQFNASIGVCALQVCMCGASSTNKKHSCQHSVNGNAVVSSFDYLVMLTADLLP